MYNHRKINTCDELVVIKFKLKITDIFFQPPWIELRPLQILTCDLFREIYWTVFAYIYWQWYKLLRNKAAAFLAKIEGCNFRPSQSIPLGRGCTLQDWDWKGSKNANSRWWMRRVTWLRTNLDTCFLTSVLIWEPLLWKCQNRRLSEVATTSTYILGKYMILVTISVKCLRKIK